MDHSAKKWKIWLFLISLACGAGGETLLFLHRQCHQARSMLLDDFRVVAFLNSDLTESKQKVVAEKIRALSGVADVRFVSRDVALEQLKSQDPELVQSIALLGENPLPAAFEIRLDQETIAGMPAWVDAASKLPEIAEIQFKALEVNAILQMEFYSRFMDLTMSLAAAAWLLAAAFGLWFSSHRKEHRHFWKEAGKRVVVAALGTISGIGLVYAAAYPLKLTAHLWIWPSWQNQALLIVIGAVGVCFWPEDRIPPYPGNKRIEKRHVPEAAPIEITEVEDLAADAEG